MRERHKESHQTNSPIPLPAICNRLGLMNTKPATSLAQTIVGVLAILVLSSCNNAAPVVGDTTPIVIITDMEPDDRIALHLLISLFPERVNLIGTTVMHSYRKMVLAERLLQQLNMAHIPVSQGSGGTANDYPDVVSSRAGREYDLEGAGILDRSTLRNIAKQARTSKNFQTELRRILNSNQSVEIILLAPPTDLTALLEESPELATHISRVHVMGGWTEVKQSTGAELRTTYNWNMDPIASKQLLMFDALPITIYSSHVLHVSFPTRSIQRANYPKLIEQLESSSKRLPSIAEFFIAGSSWDNHLMDRIPALEKAIGRENAGRQFGPADPAVVVGAFAPEAIKKRTLVKVRLDEKDLDPNSGFRVYVEPSADSKIELVDSFDEILFERVFVDAFESLSLNPAAAN